MFKCWNCRKEIDGEPLYFGLKDDIVNGFEYGEPIIHSVMKRNKKVKGSVVRLYCDKCFPVERENRKKRENQFCTLRDSMMFERAVSAIERQNIDVYEYEEAINAVQEYMTEHPRKFDSSVEIIAAIVLIYNEVRTKIQQKVGEYFVDFLLPDMRVALEIDGIFHETNKAKTKDSSRDIGIRNILGSEWEVVRVPTKHLENKAEMLVVAIEAAKASKKDIRTKNNGLLPEQYKEFKTKRVRKI